MKQWIKDMAGLGTGLWLMGYLASLALYFTPIWETMGGWVLLIIFTPVTIAITWWWFRTAGLPPPPLLRECRDCVDADCNRP